MKLKGGDSLPGVKKRKKKNSASITIPQDGKEDTRIAIEGSSDASKSEDLRRVLHGFDLPSPGENEDRRTAHEKKYDAHMRKLEEERLRSMATKSHRERIKEFNDKLANLSEHHDIPKVEFVLPSMMVACCNMCNETSPPYIPGWSWLIPLYCQDSSSNLRTLK